MSVPCEVRIKRVYEEPVKNDGMRVLVDRLWPRGLSKEGAKIDLWLKEIAPSDELRRWFGHQEDRWEEYRKRYRQELKDNPQAVDRLSAICRNQPTTLLFAARDDQRNNAVVLRDYLKDTDVGRS